MRQEKYFSKRCSL